VNQQLPKTNNIRLDQFLAAQLNISRVIAQKMIKLGTATVNGKPAKAALIIQTADTITITEPPPIKTSQITAQKMDIDLLYEDKDILIVNKQVGLVVHPVNDQQKDTLVNALLAYSPTLAKSDDHLRPGIVHRLDKDTEGLMIIAKTNIAFEDLKKQFKDRKIHKKYYGVIKGAPPQDDYVVEKAIARQSNNRKKMKVVRDGHPKAKPAKTLIKIIKRFGTKSFADITPVTGRTHQIRVHLAHIGFPVLGETMYAKKNAKGSGHLLQAYYLSFYHPTKKVKMSFKLPLSPRLNIS